jgi:anaerobic magnesium-protoporphyrin IX monomethyl ester cyclase
MALKLLLINASDFWLKINDTDLDQVIPPIGLMSLSAYLKQKFGSKVETRITDYIVDIRSYDNLVSLIRSFEPDVIGVRGLTIFKDRFDMIAETAKQHSSAIVIGGGAYVSSDAHYGLSNQSVDLSVIGEGEETLAEIVQRLLDHESLDGISGTACVIDSHVVLNPARAYINDLNTLPLPDYESIDLEPYSHYLSYGYNKRLQGVICSSRGCVFNCSFCHNLFGKKYRARNAMSVVEEIEYLFGRGVRDFYFIDDNFNYDRVRAIEIFERIISKDLNKHIKIYFVNGLKGDLADESLIDAMSDAGTIWVGYAIETLSKKLLRAIRSLWIRLKSKEQSGIRSKRSFS